MLSTAGSSTSFPNGKVWGLKATRSGLRGLSTSRELSGRLWKRAREFYVPSESSVNLKTRTMLAVAKTCNAACAFNFPKSVSHA